MKLKTPLMTLALTTATIMPIFGAGTANAATSSVYQHGTIAQAHYKDYASCEAGKKGVLTTLTQAKATKIAAGLCHPYDIVQNKQHLTGWAFDTTYARTSPVWSSDRNLGITPHSTAGAHSFKTTGSYANKADAIAIEASRVKTINMDPSMKLTWRSGVKQDAVTKKWAYEINYTSRTPMYGGHIEISELPNVTSPSIGVTAPIPVTPTKDAKDSGIKNPGDASPGWNNGGTTPSTPVVVNPPKDLDPTDNTTTNPNGTVTDEDTDKTVGIAGLDLSSHTLVNDWEGWKNLGVKYVYTKATEGSYYKNPKFNDQFSGAKANQIIPGAYHFAVPSNSTGASQADYFVNNGGGWKSNAASPELPGALDIEWNPYGNTCYDMSQKDMQNWITEFTTQYKARTGTYPIIYTANAWWKQCVGSGFTTKSPLWLASYQSTPGAIPAPWTSQLVWQTGAVNSKGYDTDIFNGTLTQLKQYAVNGTK